MGQGMLRADTARIVDARGRAVRLRGVNLGGWLMMEGYILHSLNLPERHFKREFRRRVGARALRDFERSFRAHFIREDDVKLIARMGFNCIRLPFNYRLIERAPYRYDAGGLAYLDAAIRWAKKYGIWVILDLHAAPGAQNHDWHSDSDGNARLWKSERFRARTYALWEWLASRYCNEETVAGYDVLNEAVVGDTRVLNAFYRTLIKRIRRIDRNHMIFVEGNNWATDIECLDDFNDDNIVLSIHAYQPLDTTFNFVPYQSYPQKKWTRATMRALLRKYSQHARQCGRPVFVGEFGVNSREGRCGEGRWLTDMLRCFDEFGFHWTYWTYKAVKNSIFPDGIFSYCGNPPWVNRQGPDMGFATYSRLWTRKRPEMIRSWHTGHFEKNNIIAQVLTDATS